MQSLLPFLIFAFVASITPGPTNILVLGHGARFGLRATLPLVLGASLAAALIVLLVGLGLGEALQRYPRVQQAMSLLVALWLSWLAWQLLRSAAQSFEAASATHRELGPLGAALLQLVNPKVWMMAVAVVSVFAA
ncbi:MAG TPA: lysine transporter LysE, partial [Pseudomonas sp.]|nr:lysine transporter LysE [Pseudomonas sp.]